MRSVGVVFFLVTLLLFQAGSALAAFSGWSPAGPYLHWETWDNGFEGWNLFGAPSSRIVDANGHEKVFDNNGDPNYNSGAVMQEAIDIVPGMEFHVSAHLQVDSYGGCWVGASFGLTGADSVDQYSYRAFKLFNYFMDGDACWASPTSRRRHSYIVTSGGLSGSGAENYYGGEDYFYADDSVNSWRTIRVVVNEDYRFDVYLDEVLTGTSQLPIPEEYRNGVHIILGDRSSGYGGKAYMNGIAIIGPPIDANQAPVADAGSDQAVVQIGTTVLLDGSLSYDPDGDDLTFKWSLTEVPEGSSATLSSASSATPTFVADVNGDYVASLVVSDPSGVESVDSVRVSFENMAPTTDAGLDQSTVQGTTLYLDGTNSSDPNLDPLTYSWEIVSAPEMSTDSIAQPFSPTPTFTPTIPGEYIVSLTVSDGFEVSAPSTMTVLSISYQEATLNSLLGVQSEINAIDKCYLRNKNMLKPLSRKTNSSLEMVTSENYDEAWSKIEFDLLGKIDGCYSTDSPDKNDWVTSCSVQQSVSSSLYETVNNMAARVNWDLVLSETLCGAGEVTDYVLMFTSKGTAPPVAPVVCQDGSVGAPSSLLGSPIAAPVNRPTLIFGGKVVFGDPRALEILQGMEDGI